MKSPTNTVTVQNLKAGTIYVFQVRARTVAGYGRYSGKMYFQTMTEGEEQMDHVLHQQHWQGLGPGQWSLARLLPSLFCGFSLPYAPHSANISV